MKNTTSEYIPPQDNSKLDTTPASSQLDKWMMLDPDHGPDNVVVELGQLLKPGSTVFEFGAGRWRNAIPLSKSLMNVSVQDSWKTAIQDLAENAQKNNYSITTEASFAQEQELSGLFDACVCIRLLHFLSPVDARKVIRNMQDHTKPWGWNVLSFFTDETPHSKEYFFPSLEDMKDIYTNEGWPIYKIFPKTLSEPHPITGRIMHQQKIIFHRSIML